MGKFITVEGGEGAGKSSNLNLIVNFLQEAGKDVVVTREPGGTRIGEQLRNMLLDPENSDMHYRTELLMMFAARAQHIAEVIQPALDAGKWVVCDRFTDATYAYQGGGRGINTEEIAVLEKWVQGSLRPDVTILL
ncbi:MAG: dTMP kinase, partial [Gammaproteobacteria bacterium]|nr:dTMP kinase [Gammaproteobacteria bacterium]